MSARTCICESNYAFMGSYLHILEKGLAQQGPGLPRMRSLLRGYYFPALYRVTI